MRIGDASWLLARLGTSWTRNLRRAKHWWQRRTRGWDESEIWSLDITLSAWLWPRLELLRDHEHGYPWALDEETWFAILDKLAQTFRFIAEDEDNPARWAYIEEGLDLFREFFHDLWD